MKEKHSRSILKSVIWRLGGILVLGIVTYLVTRSWIQTTLITFIHHGIFLIVYYGHERFWLWVGDRVTGKKRYVYRVILYEIVLGFLILGSITFLITGSWLAMSTITLIYIFSKVWIYVGYDKIWEKIKYGRKDE